MLAPDMMIHIELKGPRDPEKVPDYNYDLVADKVIALINQYDISKRVMISSFSTEALGSIIKKSPVDRGFLI